VTSAVPSGDNQPDSKATPTSELLLRIVSGCIMAAIALGAVMLSPWSFLALVIVVGGLLAWEWGSATRGTGFDATALIQAVCIAAVALFVAMTRIDLAALLLGACCGVLAFAAPERRQGIWAAAGLLYIALPVAALVWLRSDPSYGLMAILLLLTVVWTTDTASYVSGRTLGGPKLAPPISPKKTWSGFIVGTLTPALVGYGFGLSLGSTSPLALAGISIVLALACQVGDLLESAVKRRLGLKDMSQLIPGHGGVFDRIDSLLLAAVVAALIALRNVASPGAGLLIW
jgi:phosphatidate cytidylyltransferase